MPDAQDPVALLRGLRAVRNFLPEPVPQGVVDDLLAVARWTGSARNLQPWEFVLVRERDTLEALGALEGSVGHLRGAALGFVLVMAGDPAAEAQETFDEGRLSERVMLAAAAHGVGSCIGWWRGEGRTGAKRLLGIPQGRLVRTVRLRSATPTRRRNPPARSRRRPVSRWRNCCTRNAFAGSGQRPAADR